MRNCSKTLGGLALAGGVLCAGGDLGGCRSEQSASRQPATSDAARGIGFQVEASGRVVRGAIITTPPGREEALLPLVAGGVPAWTKACPQDATRSLLTFKFQTDSSGHLQVAPVATNTSEAARCLAARASVAATGPLPPDTEITVELLPP